MSTPLIVCYCTGIAKSIPHGHMVIALWYFNSFHWQPTKHNLLKENCEIPSGELRQKYKTVGWSYCSDFLFWHTWNEQREQRPDVCGVWYFLLMLSATWLRDSEFFASTCVNFLLHRLNIPTGINKAAAYLILLINKLVTDVCSSVSYTVILSLFTVHV